MRPFSHLDIAHAFWQMAVKPGDTVIDATAGNGHDSLFLANLALTAPSGKLIVLDVQKAALENTKMRLKDFSNDQIFIYEMCHSRMQEVAAPMSAKLIAFNLGYLPGADKSFTTMCKTTLTAIQASLDIIQPLGLISITCYPGHSEGLFEEEAILTFLETLDPKQWSISSHKFLNCPKHPHLLLIGRNQS